MKPTRRSRVLRSVVAHATLAALAAHAAAAPISLSTAPAGTVPRAPAPNVIITLDDSGSMIGNSMIALKQALNDTFTTANVPDKSIRLGWNAMNRCTSIPSSSGGCENLNKIRVLDSTQRANFLRWVNGDQATTPLGLFADGVTPTHPAYIAAGDHLRNSSPTNVDGPWASVPGTTLQPVLSCRKSYSVLMTDGGWNHSFFGESVTRGGGNADGTTRTLPDGTVYDTTSPQTRIYRDTWGAGTVSYGVPSGTGTLSTMADLAFFYWATDLTGLPRTVVPRVRRAGPETFTATDGRRVSIDEYWNPKNDPATWQHMTTYTIGFRDAASWSSSDPKFASYPVWGGDTYAGSFADLITGAKSWPDPIGDTPALFGDFEQSRKTELWHMAINSRGKFIPATTSQDLVNAFKDIMNEILQDSAAPTTSLVGSSRSTRQASAAFSAGFRARDWSGYVRRDELQAGTGALETSAAKWKWGSITSGNPAVTQPRTTADLMDQQPADWPSSRLILSHKTESVGGSMVRTPISWEWANLSDAQRTALKTVGGVTDTSATADTTAQDRMAYLRGNRTKEQGASPAGPFRTRGSRQGDIVNSKLWYLKGQPASGYTLHNYADFRSTNSARASMLYVGGNDGMLHGFDADTGIEKLAYIPEGLHPALANLTRPGYTHRYYVDGSPFTGDWWDGSAWKTYLAGTLGAGGRGYFLLDVTDPTQFTAANSGSIVVMDRTGGTLDADVGHIMSEPVMERSDPSITRQITRMNNGRWALVMGNGYNSASEKAVLLIQYLDGAKELRKITAEGAGGNGNGLSAPRLIDLNGDKVPDIAYAGDLRGNLWKFDLASASAANWRVAFSGSPLYTARDATSAAAPQPITSAPLYLSHPKGGLMVVFGTGRTLSNADRAATQPQTVYGIYDNSTITTTANAATPNSTLGTVTVTAGTAPSTPVTNGRASLVRQTIGTNAVGNTSDTNSAVYGLSSNAVDYTGSSPKRGWYLDLPITRERVTENLTWFDGDLIDLRSTIPAIGVDPNVETCEVPITTEQSYLTTLNAINGSAPRSQLYAYNTSTAGGANGSRVQSSLTIWVRDANREISVAAPGSPKPPNRNLLGKVTLRPSWRQLQ